MRVFLLGYFKKTLRVKCILFCLCLYKSFNGFFCISRLTSISKLDLSSGDLVRDVNWGKRSFDYPVSSPRYRFGISFQSRPKGLFIFVPFRHNTPTFSCLFHLVPFFYSTLSLLFKSFVVILSHFSSPFFHCPLLRPFYLFLV